VFSCSHIYILTDQLAITQAPHIFPNRLNLILSGWYTNIHIVIRVGLLEHNKEVPLLFLSEPGRNVCGRRRYDLANDHLGVWSANYMHSYLLTDRNVANVILYCNHVRTDHTTACPNSQERLFGQMSRCIVRLISGAVLVCIVFVFPLVHFFPESVTLFRSGVRIWVVKLICMYVSSWYT